METKAKDPGNIARNALVIMIGGLQNLLGIPLAYFLTHERFMKTLHTSIYC